MRALLLLGLLLGTAEVGFAQDAGVGGAVPATGSRAAEAEADADEPPPPRPRRPVESRPVPAADAEADTEADTDTDTATDTDTDTAADTDTDTAADTNADSDPDSAADPDSESESDSETETETDSDSDSRSPTAESDSRPSTADSESPTTGSDERVTTRVERHTETRFVPMAGDSGSDPITAEIEELSELFGSDRSLSALALLLLVVLLSALAAVALRRVRERLEPTGLLPTLLALVHLGLRLVAVAFALALLIRVLPPRASLVMLLAFGGVAIAVGWSSRDVLPDLVAGFLLVFERRIRSGMWLVGDGFAGQVRRVGVRSTLLIDVMGRQVEVPNRHLVRSPLTSDASGEQEHEVLVRFESEAPAEQIRAALRDAVLASPWVLPGSAGVVLRDSDEPWLWRVRGHLLDPTLVSRFEGDLLERAEEILAAFEEAGRTPHDVTRARTSRKEGDAL